MLVVGLTIVVLSTLVLFVPLFLVAVVKLLVPVRPVRDACSRVLARIAELWAGVNNLMMDVLTTTRFEVEGVAGLRRDATYVVVSNHQSWVDIPVLQKAFGGRIPLMRFFLKQQLIWVPLLGFAWWALDYPFMKRFSREKVRRRPELAGKDLETTRKACERYRRIPVTVMNFLEGTRFSPAKRDAGHGGYRHLLSPKAGGLAYVIAAMGPQIESLLDVTIIYPPGVGSIRDLFMNRIPWVKVVVRNRGIPQELVDGDYAADPRFRERFQEWVSRMWREKDELLDAHLTAGGHGSAREDAS